MNIQQLDLTIPQRHLMEIFANADPISTYGDECVRSLLTYVQSLLTEIHYSSPTLDRMLAGTLPHIDFERRIMVALCEAYDCSIDECGVSLSEITQDDYRGMLQNCYPKIIDDLFPEPVKSIDPTQNLLVTWEMGYGLKIREELWNIENEEFRAILSLIYEYIMVCSSGWPVLYQSFLADWTKYLLTREWPDNEAELRAKLQEEKELRMSYQKSNIILMKKNQEYEDAKDGSFITVMEAARAVLEKIYGRDSIDKEADAWRKRVTDGKFDLGTPIEGRQGRKFYPVGNIISAFQATNQEMITDEDIAHAIDSRSISKARLTL